MAVIVIYKGKPELTRVLIVSELTNKPKLKAKKINIVDGLQSSVSKSSINVQNIPRYSIVRYSNCSPKTWKQYGADKQWARHLV